MFLRDYGGIWDWFDGVESSWLSPGLALVHARCKIVKYIIDLISITLTTLTKEIKSEAQAGLTAGA